MTKDEFFSALSNLSVWERDGERAPHKPIMLLYALAMLKHGHRQFDFSEIEKPIESILETILPKRKNIHVHYPFWYLKTKGKTSGQTIWEIHGAEQIKFRKGKTEPLKSELRNNHIEAGFTSDVLSLLDREPEVIDISIQLLLDGQFPRSIQEDICAMLGIDDIDLSEACIPASIERKPRDPKFREKVLIAYKGECAVCGYSLRVKDRLAGIEAAHIKWHQAGGPDVVPNALSLCSTHHILFDRGAFTIDKELKIGVSDSMSGELLYDIVTRFNGASIRLPQRECHYPSEEFLSWHKEQVLVGELL